MAAAVARVIDERAAFEAHYPELRTCASSRIWQLCEAFAAADREDMTEDVMLKLWRCWPKIVGVPIAEQRAWVWRVATNRAYDSLRRTQRRVRLVPLDRDYGYEMDGATTDYLARRARVDALLPLLSTGQRAAVEAVLTGKPFEPSAKCRAIKRLRRLVRTGC